MMLLVDIGNSRVKWARADGAAVQAPDAAEHRGAPAEMLKTKGLPAAESVWVANVMGTEREAEIAGVLGAACGGPVRFARTQEERDGLRVAYADPERLGVDRWLGMLALWAQTGQAFCVVHAGTALTFDAVDEGGQHLGGLIAPGLTTAQAAVRAATRFGRSMGAAAGPGTETIDPRRPGAPKYGGGLGVDTDSCVRQGALHACAGMVERAARNASGAHVITGGDAPTLLPHLPRGWDWKPHLVLDGLLAYARGENAA